MTQSLWWGVMRHTPALPPVHRHHFIAKRLLWQEKCWMRWLQQQQQQRVSRLPGNRGGQTWSHCLQTHSSSCCATAGKDKLWSWNHTTVKLLLNIHWLVSSNLLFGFLFFFFPLLFSLSCMPILTRPLGHKCTTLMRHNREACSSFDDSELLNNGTVRAKPQHTHSEWNQISRLTIQPNNSYPGTLQECNVRRQLTGWNFCASSSWNKKWKNRF